MTTVDVGVGCGDLGGALIILGGRGSSPSALPGISPSGGEISGRPYRRFNRKRRKRRDVAACRSPPLRGRCQAGQRG
ncbi:protein of unknown function [Agrobacterium pusense]|uniref:Uncharacterized protein n=1 Tax=Agrobacterium pusense TaxID=648995 RepID=U4Q8G6_9HYPH|nr:protein of unknown function [Agrobacterium pusense]